MNMVEGIKIFINSIIMGIAFIKVGNILLKEKSENTRIELLILCILNAIVLTLNHVIVNNVIKVIFGLLDLVLLGKIIYKKEISKSIILAFLYYLILMISEWIVILIMSGIYYIFSLGAVENIKNTIAISIMIEIFTISIIYILKNRFQKILEKTDSNSPLILGILAVLILISIISVFYKIEISGWKLDKNYILDTIIIIAMGIVGVSVIKQKVNYDKIEKQYKDLAKYSEINATLLEEYSMLNHEHKNQLIIIESMLENKDKELEEYVKSLIHKKDKIKFKWIRELNNITFQGLKSFMNYKILEMESQEINVYITVSKECKKYKLETMSNSDKDKLYSIIGVYLDNAIDAAKNSEDKKIVISIYVDNNQIVFEIANTYTGEIDIKKINNYGYTSKGIGHGTGLYMVQVLTKDSDKFQTHTTLQNEFFIQLLKIKCEN